LKGGIVLTGGTSRMKGIDALAREITGMEVRLALPDVHVSDQSLALAQDPSHATVIGLLLKAKAEGAPALVTTLTRHTHQPAATAKQFTGLMGGAAPVKQTAEPEQEPEQENKTEKPRRSKKDKGGSGIKKWFEGFLSEPLDGDEDF
jgi:cell division protein FtsA